MLYCWRAVIKQQIGLVHRTTCYTVFTAICWLVADRPLIIIIIYIHNILVRIIQYSKYAYYGIIYYNTYKLVARIYGEIAVSANVNNIYEYLFIFIFRRFRIRISSVQSCLPVYEHSYYYTSILVLK